MSVTMFNLTVRFRTDASAYAIWQVWRDKGEVRVGLSSGYCYPWPFSADELGAVVAEIYAKMGSQVDDVRVRPAIDDAEAK